MNKDRRTKVRFMPQRSQKFSDGIAPVKCRLIALVLLWNYASLQKQTAMNKITPFLWFDNNIEEAINFYKSVFKNAKVNYMNKMGDQVFSAAFELEGQEFM